MSVSPTTLDFGDTAQEQTLEIKNTGEVNLDWKIKGITSDCITVSESEGTVAPAGKKVVQVKLDTEHRQYGQRGTELEHHECV